MMRKVQAGRMLLWIIPAMMVLWGTYQLYDLYKSKHAHQDASRMLFEASSFQVELMSRFLSEAVGVKLSSQLDSLRNAVYSASYIHDRFVRIFPAGQVDDLASLKELLQFLLHLQIGGDRPLKEEEQQMLHQLEPIYKELTEVYSAMMNESGKLNRYECGLVKELDERAFKILKR